MRMSVCQCVTFFNFTPRGCSPTYHTILESGRLREQIKNIPGRIRTRNPEILDSQVLITAIVFGDFLRDFLRRIFLYDNNFYNLEINLGIIEINCEIQRKSPMK